MDEIFRPRQGTVAAQFDVSERVVVYPGDCLQLLETVPDGAVQLVVTSPPYNIGKEYERRLEPETYFRQQAEVIHECIRCLAPGGSICWQVGNYVSKGSIVPLDAILYPVFSGGGLKLRNRIIWHFEHGLHCSRRFSGRYETILWFTKGDEYIFNLDPVQRMQCTLLTETLCRRTALENLQVSLAGAGRWAGARPRHQAGKQEAPSGPHGD